MQNRFRIIGGQWRGRRFVFPDEPGLRPSPDRVRETLFNWLAPIITGARCVDLFCGSGALGLEALSRGASSVEFVDRSRPAMAAIEQHLQVLHCKDGRITQADVGAWTGRAHEPFDIVFLDPPFGAGLVAPTLAALDHGGLVRAGARIYVESEATAGAPELPAGWDLHRQGRAGRVGYHLAVFSR
jgi:16S rRNA (guanine966-N2)-methyltransferase